MQQPESVYANDMREILLRLQEVEQRRLTDEAMWAQAKETGSIVCYQSYLANFTSGNHTDEAKAEIERILASDTAWTRIANSEDVGLYRAYLQKFPTGHHAGSARETIARLERRLADEGAWAEVVAGDFLLADLLRYLTRFDNGLHLLDAQKMVRKSLESVTADNAAEDEDWRQVVKENNLAAYSRYWERWQTTRHLGELLTAVERLVSSAYVENAVTCLIGAGGTKP
jgi:hypothetical protein